MNDIGFIQGRLVDQIDNKIQAFPQQDWISELKIAQDNKLNFIELTIDYDRVWENPISSSIGSRYLKKKLTEHQIKPIACTADYVMHNPPWGSSFSEMVHISKKVIKGLGYISCKVLVIPFVDNTSLSSKDEHNALDFLLELEPYLKKHNVRIAIESDYSPLDLSDFIKNLPEENFGINYDIGNSASLGYDHKLEIDSYFDRIIHVHIKDRKYLGNTVPLGQGDAKLDDVLRLFKSYKYKHNFSMQTARDNSGNHLKAMLKYIEIVKKALDG